MRTKVQKVTETWAECPGCKRMVRVREKRGKLILANHSQQPGRFDGPRCRKSGSPDYDRKTVEYRTVECLLVSFS